MSYQELKNLKKANVLHIDVRERWEIERDGKIPASINIPCKILALLPGNVCWCSLARLWTHDRRTPGFGGDLEIIWSHSH